MPTISSKEFETQIADPICHALIESLFATYSQIMSAYNLSDKVLSLKDFEDLFYSSGIGPDLRDLSIDLFHEAKMDIKDNDKSF